MIEYFDNKLNEAPGARDSERISHCWDIMTPSERRSIHSEMEACRRSFNWSAKNYFHIINRDTKQKQLFSLWPSQERIYEEMIKLKESGRSQRVVIIKSRQLGCSTLIEGLIAWRTMYFPNINAFIVSYDQPHSSFLFGLMQYIYDNLPWWMKPMYSSREINDGLIFDNPSYEDKRLNPGLNSRVTVRWASSTTAVGQGVPIGAFHGSEFCDWEEKKAKTIIEEDVVNALADSPETFGVLESTPKGAGTYAHGFWNEMERLGDDAMWKTIYLPWFFDAAHRKTITYGWKPQKQELMIRDRAHNDWVRCDVPECGQYHLRYKVDGEDRISNNCNTCNSGKLAAFLIPDEQLAWMEWRRKQCGSDVEKLQRLRQEQSSTSNESFVVSGLELFPEEALDYADKCVRQPIAMGYINKALEFHGYNFSNGFCFKSGCMVDHSGDNRSLLIWEFPVRGAKYQIGSDVGYGILKDYSTVQVLKTDPVTGNDIQVARLARNDIDTVSFAEEVNRVGRFYNTCEVAMEANIDSACSHLKNNLQYPNLYRKKNLGNANVQSQQFHWHTFGHTKPRLFESLRNRLISHRIIIRDVDTVRELKCFKHEHDGNKVGAAVGHDDLAMALMIALYTSHELDWDEDGGTLRVSAPMDLESAPYVYTCERCAHRWPAGHPKEYKECPKCGCYLISFKEQRTESDVNIEDIADEHGAVGLDGRGLDEELTRETKLFDFDDDSVQDPVFDTYY